MRPQAAPGFPGAASRPWHPVPALASAQEERDGPRFLPSSCCSEPLPSLHPVTRDALRVLCELAQAGHRNNGPWAEGHVGTLHHGAPSSLGCHQDGRLCLYIGDSHIRKSPGETVLPTSIPPGRLEPQKSPQIELTPFCCFPAFLCQFLGSLEHLRDHTLVWCQACPAPPCCGAAHGCRHYRDLVPTVRRKQR